MRNFIIFLIAINFTFQINLFSQFDVRVRPAGFGFVYTAHILPTSNVTFPNTNNDVSMHIVASLEKNGSNPAPTVISAVCSLFPTLSLNQLGVQSINNRWVYTFLFDGGVSNTTPTLLAGVEQIAAVITFSSEVQGLPRFDNLITDSSQSYWYFEINGNQRSDTEGNPFYGAGSTGSYDSGDLYKVAEMALPIILLDFTVSKYENKFSYLNWSTSSETNSSHFGIERSLNGFRWETIGRVAAAGTSRGERAYRFFDDQLPRFTSSEQEVYYRLKLCDQDGRYQYSEIRSVLFERNEGFIQVYPNPATQKLYIDLSGIDHNGDEMELMVIGMDGSLVMRKTFKASDVEPVQIDQLPANTYQIMVKHGDQVYQQRLVKVD